MKLWEAWVAVPILWDHTLSNIFFYEIKYELNVLAYLHILKHMYIYIYIYMN